MEQVDRYVGSVAGDVLDSLIVHDGVYSPEPQEVSYEGVPHLSPEFRVGIDRELREKGIGLLDKEFLLFLVAIEVL